MSRASAAPGSSPASLQTKSLFAFEGLVLSLDSRDRRVRQNTVWNRCHQFKTDQTRYQKAVVVPASYLCAKLTGEVIMWAAKVPRTCRKTKLVFRKIIATVAIGRTSAVDTAAGTEVAGIEAVRSATIASLACSRMPHTFQSWASVLETSCKDLRHC